MGENWKCAELIKITSIASTRPERMYNTCSSLAAKLLG
jgi:hypothetical protein